MSHTLDDVRREYDRLDALCGVDTTQVALRVSKRARKRLGSCKYVGNPVESVTISDFVLDAADEVFYDTIRHEYAHALIKLRFPRERHGHDARWKAACLEVGCAPERCCDPAVLPELPPRRQETYHYRLNCRICGMSWQYKRMTKVLRLVSRGGSRYCTCPQCKGHSFAVVTL